MAEIEKWIRVIDGKLAISTAGACEIFGVSQPAMKKWADDGCPKIKVGWWALKDLVEWRGLGNTASGPQGREKSLVQRKLEAEVLYKEASGELTSLKRDIAAGKYIMQTDVAEDLRHFFAIFRRSALAIPRRVAGKISAQVDAPTARKIESDLRAEVTDILEQMSVDGTYHAKSNKRGPGRPSSI